jgi:hypothetical protein
MTVVREFMRHVVPQVIKPLRALWNQMIGLVFVVFAIAAASQTFHAWREFNERGEGFLRLTVSAIFFLIMGGFGVSSFLRARRISRS